MQKSDKISFLLGNEQVNINPQEENLRTDTTILQYLRGRTERKSIKEGCAEGDCGACTVVIAEPMGKFMRYKAINSCVTFLPSIHGKQLLTTEDLGTSKNLHPIQEALVEHDASQCGFCTPGFAMSIFGLFKNINDPDYVEIKEALAGNLCRCTGYRPIIDAAEDACVYKGMDRFTGLEKKVFGELKGIRKQEQNLELYSDNQSYFLPSDIKTALELRKKYSSSIIVNGASDVALRVTKRKEKLDCVIDLSQVKELLGIKVTKEGIEIGAGETLENIRVEIEEKLPALYKMLNVFGSLQIRNSAVIGGNIGSASPIGDTLPVLMVYSSLVELTNSKQEKREILLSEFITDYRTTQIKKDEIISKVRVPFTEEGFMVLSYKISKRKDLDISTVCSGFGIKLDDKTVKKISLFYGGMAAYTKNAKLTEEYLLGKEWNIENIEKATKLLDKDFQPLSDARSSAEGRMQMAKNLLIKFWDETKH